MKQCRSYVFFFNYWRDTFDSTTYTHFAKRIDFKSNILSKDQWALSENSSLKRLCFILICLAIQKHEETYRKWIWYVVYLSVRIDGLHCGKGASFDDSTDSLIGRIGQQAGQIFHRKLYHLSNPSIFLHRLYGSNFATQTLEAYFYIKFGHAVDRIFQCFTKIKNYCCMLLYVYFSGRTSGIDLKFYLQNPVSITLLTAKFYMKNMVYFFWKIDFVCIKRIMLLLPVRAAPQAILNRTYFCAVLIFRHALIVLSKFVVNFSKYFLSFYFVTLQYTHFNPLIENGGNIYIPTVILE